MRKIISNKTVKSIYMFDNLSDNIITRIKCDNRSRRKNRNQTSMMKISKNEGDGRKDG